MKTRSLFELPEVLFHQFLNHLGVKDIKTFVLKNENGNNVKIACLYATLPRHGEYENPTLVFVDLRGITGITEVIVLNQPPMLRNEETDNLRNYASVSARHHGNNKGVFEISLKVNFPYSGCVEFGDPFTKFSAGYLIELYQRAEELFRSNKYDWVKQYKKDAALV